MSSRSAESSNEERASNPTTIDQVPEVSPTEKSGAQPIDLASQTTPTATIADLRSMPNLWYKINVFVYDLRNFRERPDARSRLDSISDSSYIGQPYFTGSNATILKSIVIEEDKCLAQVIEETLNERLERRKRNVSRVVTVVCVQRTISLQFSRRLSISSTRL